MKKTTLSFILVLILMLTAASAVCYADAPLDSIVLEQVYSCMPEIKAYVYPMDANGNVIHSMNVENTKIEAILGGENLTVESFGSAKEEGCCIIAVLNTSSGETGYENLRMFKSDMAAALDKLGTNDKFILITSGEKNIVLLDGSETREAAKKIVDNISASSGTSDVLGALYEAIRISSDEKNIVPSRHILALYDRGAFMQKETQIVTQLSSDLLKSDLPLYFVCTRNNDDVQYAASEFARSTRGRSFHANDKATEKLAAWVSNAQVLRARASNNNPEPRLRNLRIVFNAKPTECIVDTQIQITKYVKDTEAPILLSVECEDDSTVKLTYSENVLFADDPKNFTVETSDGAQKIGVKDASYNSVTYTTTLKLEEKLKYGDYKITVNYVTDDSYEANPLVGGVDAAFSWEKGSPSVLLYVIIAAAVVVVAVVAFLIVFANKKKQKEIEDQQREKEEQEARNRRREENKTASFVNQVNLNNGMPVRLTVTMPNGLTTKSQITVGNNFVIGRSSKTNLKLDDETVSSRHLTLSVVGGKLIASDNGSTNGSFVNGVKISRPQPLNKGDKLHIGNTDIIIDY